MRIDRVVVNASPLITLFRSGQADLLPELFDEVVVPEAVWEEVVRGGPNDPAARALDRTSWAIRRSVEISARVAPWNLGEGETSVLSFSLLQPEYRAVLDDREARRCARTLGVGMLGTGGILVLAKRRGLIESVAAGIERLRDAGLWLGPDVQGLLLREGEE